MENPGLCMGTHVATEAYSVFCDNEATVNCINKGGGGGGGSQALLIAKLLRLLTLKAMFGNFGNLLSGLHMFQARLTALLTLSPENRLTSSSIWSLDPAVSQQRSPTKS